MTLPEVDLFDVLIAAAESRNLSQAAEKLRISQPAVSVKLKELERQTPLPLFSLEGKRKVLTHYGRELYRIAKQNRTLLSEGYEALNRRYASAENLTLKVGGRRELFEPLAPKLRFDGRVSFVSLTSTQAVEQMVDHTIDIAIAYSPPDSPEIMAKKVLESTAKFVVHKKFLKSKLSENIVRHAEFLLETPCVIYQEDGHLLREWTGHVNVEFENLRVSGVAEDWRSVQALVDSGWGYSIVPSYVSSANDDVVSISLPESVLPKYVFYTLFYRDLRKIPAFRAVLEGLTKADSLPR
jgi:DNA-binding transcriptional LysR family regulator